MLITLALAAQSVAVPLSAADWDATDSIRSESYLGRPSLYINRGTALARNVTLENGTVEYDVAATAPTNFIGLAFRAASPRFTEVVFLRLRQSGTSEAMQYAPAFNNLGAAWQVYHGPKANAVVTIPRERWVHVRIELDGSAARVFYDTATAPTLTWRPVATEPDGFVLVNRFYEQPNAAPPIDPQTRELLVDSVMTGKVAGSKVVYARATIDAPRERLQRLTFCYSDGVVIYLNGQPLAFAMNPQYLRDDLGVMARFADAVYLPLKRGRNELVFAVIELGGGWAFGAKLDP